MADIAKVMGNEADVKYFKVALLSFHQAKCKASISHAFAEHIRCLRIEMGRTRHVPRRLPREISILLVRLLDNPLQPLQRRFALLPSGWYISFSIPLLDLRRTQSPVP